MSEPPRKFSDDGRWWWDGQAWKPAVSEDGFWRWNGKDWVAASPAPPKDSRPARGTLLSAAQTSARRLPLVRAARRWAPGFRSGSVWKAVVGSLFYLLCLFGLLLGLVAGFAMGQWWLLGWSVSSLAIGVIAIYLLRYWRVKPLNVALIGALVLSFSMSGVSLANVPSQPTASRNSVASVTPTPTEQLASNSPVSTSTPTPTTTPTPTPTPTATPAPAPPPQAPPPPAQAPPPPPPAAPPPPPPPVPANCYPLTNAGNCYEPGEFCRTSDHGKTGRAGNGETIICQNKNGWRWEPA